VVPPVISDSTSMPTRSRTTAGMPIATTVETDI
jgi:hypothetical protein